ncbi:MAG: GNAT family N-acetyltransferase [Ferruginibacter sp.]|nr:GNAT family N-acetyltransferase [Chitinophagaceae bacterium]
MLYASTVCTPGELLQILELQDKNLSRNNDEAEIRSQGFVTFQHTPQILQQFHELAPSVIVKDSDKVIAYALTVVNEARYIFPPMESMFALLETIQWKNKPLDDYRYYEMGQVCVAKEYRGKGVFEMLYQHHKTVYSHQYDLLVTKISRQNNRSLKAHKRIGFHTITTHKDELDEWDVVIWDWHS